MAAREHFRLKNQVFVRRHGAPMSLLINIPFVNLLAPVWLTLQGYRLVQAKLLLDKKISRTRLWAFCLAQMATTLLWSAALQSLLFALGYHFWGQSAQQLISAVQKALPRLASLRDWSQGLSQWRQLHPLVPTPGFAPEQILMHLWLTLALAVALFLFVGFALASLFARHRRL
jgi:ABC-type multidrug transport system permease subunit